MEHIVTVTRLGGAFDAQCKCGAGNAGFLKRAMAEDWAIQHELMNDPKPSATQVGGSHYKDMAIQPIDFIHANKLSFIEGSVIKYVCRHAKKNGKQDLEKAIHYLQLLIEKAYP